jgi:ABC-type transporter Mla maintaining outer membrane lipid asymmetry ATPase subunit MlaF
MRGQQRPVVFDGEVIDTRDRAQLYRMRRRLGMLFQFGALFTDLSVYRQRGLPAARDDRPARAADPRHRADEAQCGRACAARRS